MPARRVLIVFSGLVLAMLMAALDAKKDVYLEKPMSHSLEESARMVRAVRKTKQIVQVGMQRRSAESILSARSSASQHMACEYTYRLGLERDSQMPASASCQ